MLEYCFIVHNKNTGLNFILTAKGNSEDNARDALDNWLSADDQVELCVIGVSYVLRTGEQ